MSKVKKKILLSYFDDYFQYSSQTCNYPTRHVLGDNYTAARFNKSSSQCLIRHFDSKLWNKLPSSIKEA